jgi:cobalt-zinc-cadmium efflux system outer membrane protein
LRIGALVALAFGLASPSELRAQPVTLGRALDLAAAQHPLLRAGQAMLDGASSAIETARAYPNPEAGVIAGRQRASGGNPAVNGAALYEVVQPLELGGLRSTRIALAERGRDASAHLLDEVRLEVLSQVRRTFFQVLRRQEESRLALENVTLVEDLRNRIRVRVEVGEIGRLELVRAEAEVASARTLATSVQLQEVTAVAQFRAAVGGVLPADLDLEGALDPDAALPPVDALRSEARARHPALRRAAAEVGRAAARTAYETAQRRPQPSIWSEVDQSGPTYRIGVRLPVPIWNQRQGPIAEARAGERQAAAAAEAREIEILSALDGAYERYAVAGQQVTLFEQGLLREAEEALRTAEVAYKLGERGILEVLDAQRLLRTVRLNYLSARFDRQAALVDLDELRGLTLPRTTP